MAVAKFLHAADLHLGSPLESLGEAIDDATYERVKALVNRAFDRLIDVAIGEGVDFVVLAGDVYDLERDRQGRHGRIMKYNLSQAGA